MTKRKIKVVKRDTPVPRPLTPPVTPKDPERDVTNVVKNWISERREKRETEKTLTHRTTEGWT